MRVIDVINSAVLLLPYSKEESKAIAIRLLIHIANLKSYTHLLEPNLELPEEVSNRIEEIMQELSQGRPIQYILGFEEFYNLKFNVKEGVLIPRPETEELVRLIVEEHQTALDKSLKILDICTGSGCIAWSLAHGLNSKVEQIHGCDISPEALEIAKNQSPKKNSEQSPNQPSSKSNTLLTPNFFSCNILSDESLITINNQSIKKFNIIVSNPPYVCNREKELMRNNVLDFEPHLALFVPDNSPLIFYEKIAILGKSLLEKGGKLYFEINEQFGEETKDLLKKLGYHNILIIKDFNNKNRFISAVIN